MFVKMPEISLVLALMGGVVSTGKAAVAFNFTNGGAATPQMMSAVAQAGQRWSDRLADSITVNIRINAADLQPGLLGATTSFYDPYAYSGVRTALLSDQHTSDDATSSSHLVAGAVHSMLINRTANNPAGVVSASVYFDTGLGGAGQAGPENNSTVRMTSANAKAMGLYPGDSAGLDAIINFTNAQAFDYDPSDGITAGQVDFVGVATHELAHALGFLSGIDTLASNGAAPGLNDNQLPFVTSLDLFRYSSRSIGVGGGLGVQDWTADNTAKYFSIDGGATSIGAWSNGATFGDSYEAHHWKNGLGLGIMNPTVAPGTLLSISNNDLRVLDAIGYDVVPEPAAIGMTVLVGLALLYRRRKCPRHA